MVALPPGMESPEAAERWAEVSPSFAGTAADLPKTSSVARALAWAGAASTLHRVRLGEGALLAVNASLILHGGATRTVQLAQLVVSVLALALMYAFNDLYDAPVDTNNPKKDPTLIGIYLAHGWIAGRAILIASLLTSALALATLGIHAAAATAGVLLVNVVYSTRLKGVPVLDVAWCGLWGVLYAAIVSASPSLLLVVGLMTAVCHLYQTLDDRAADAASAITTTAVRSPTLSRDVLVALSVLLVVTLRPALGLAWAATAFAPLLLFFVAASPRVGWLLTKAYFGVMWLALLGVASAAG